MRTFRSFEKNAKELEIVVFFWKEWMPNPDNFRLKNSTCRSFQVYSRMRNLYRFTVEEDVWENWILLCDQQSGWSPEPGARICGAGTRCKDLWSPEPGARIVEPGTRCKDLWSLEPGARICGARNQMQGFVEPGTRCKDLWSPEPGARICGARNQVHGFVEPRTRCKDLWSPEPGARICVAHFAQCSFASLRRIHLKSGAVPTIKGTVGLWVNLKCL